MSRPLTVPPRRVPVALGLTSALAVAALATPATASAARKPCAAADRGVVATLGTWEADEDSIASPGTFGEDEFVIRVAGLGVGLGELADGVVDQGLAALRAVRRDGRVTRLELCRGSALLATVRRPDPRGVVGGVSLNGDRIAWRTWRAGRPGAVSVGRVRAGRVVGIRRTPVPTLSRTAAVNGRILVTPDGSASWSVPVRGRPAVWLWPADRSSARRLRLPRGLRLDGTPSAANVRIVDPRHVLLGDTDTVLRYGPTTPGRCPVPIGAADHPTGSARIVDVAGAVYEQGTDVSAWSQTLVCDPRVGDYVHVFARSSGASKYGEYYGDSPIEVLATAGVVVDVVAFGPDASTQRLRSTVLAVGSRASTTVSGLVDDPPVLERREARGDPVGARVRPGAVAWVAEPAAEATDRAVWLADADGARRVGTIPSAGDPALALDDRHVSWGGSAPGSAVVRPVPGDAVTRIPTDGP